MKQTKPFSVTKRQVWEAWKRVKANQGGAGIDGESIGDFEANLENNLYKIWNRMASGSYHPKPVKRVDIPKASGGTRPLGIPTVADRVAQMVVKRALEPALERVFHKDSYGYRPNKSAHQALDQARKRCWKRAWVLDLDIKSFFDTIDHDLLMRAVERHTTEKWMLLYIKRWLTASVVMPDGTEEARDRGTPQGGVISPLLANLFLHYAFDRWMEIYFPSIPFERYADDVVCHCVSERQARHLWNALARRFEQVGLKPHPVKTQIVYCKSSRHRGRHPNISFNFLGYTFRPRQAKDRRGQRFTGFSPAISNKAAKAIRQQVRSWRLPRCSSLKLEDLAERYNATIRGWMTYYGVFRKSAMYSTLHAIDCQLVQWTMRKYKRFRRKWLRAFQWLTGWARRNPTLFAHWPMLHGSTLFVTRRLRRKSRVN